MCEHSGESVDHLFLRCEFALELWNRILSLSKMAWVMPSHAIKLFGHWNAYGGDSMSWSAAPLCLLRCIWKELNERLCEALELWLLLSGALYIWLWISCFDEA